jgi:hypothetical protein
VALDLLSILTQAGIQGLRDGRTEISAPCPSPTHNDAHPSWSINKVTYLHNCFACPYQGTLTSLLVDLTGSAPADLEMTLKTQGFLRQMRGVRQQPDEVLEPVLPYLTDWSLMNVLADVPQSLLDGRRLCRTAIDAYQVRWNPDSRVWVLPLRRPADGTLLGAQLRRVGMVLTQPTGLSKSVTLFGYNVVEPCDTCMLVESPLDAVRAFGLGIPAVASLGAWVSAQQIALMARCFAAVYVALDDDRAGRDGAEIVTQGLQRRGCAAIPFRYDGLTDEDGHKAKDIGDVADDGALVEAWHNTQRMGF